jgi:Na+-transporting NADH:ubiquinone oxidoreductase subunit F
MLYEILIGTVMFVTVVISLVIIILVVRFFMVKKGSVLIKINEDESGKEIETLPGSKLLQVLSSNKIFLSSACGGGGTCAQCKCIIMDGVQEATPSEEQCFTKKEIREGWRLTCQVNVKDNMSIELEPEVFGVQHWKCEVVSNNNVATFIKELVLRLPEGEDVVFKAGGFVQMEIPPYKLKFDEFEIDEEYKKDWDNYNLWDIKADFKQDTIRAYSMANYPAEKGLLKFNIRIATPPPNTNFPTGAMSSYLFNLKKGDYLDVYGPFGEFFPQETNAEMVYIGGGAGMAPLRSHLFDLLKTKGCKRKISYWYGARSKRELFYDEEFKELEIKNPNFTWNVALSEPAPEDNWEGYTGFIHNVVLDNHLKNHEAPEDCEYYLCGPPIMNTSVMQMLEDMGVEPSNIFLDDFGG